MKKIVIVLSLCLLTIMITAITITALNSFENIEVVFSENTVFTEEQKLIITEHFACVSETSETYGLKCLLFGHDYTTEYVDVIRHKVNATRPRCVLETYETKICADCSKTVPTLIYTTAIDCCE